MFKSFGGTRRPDFVNSSRKICWNAFHRKFFSTANSAANFFRHVESLIQLHSPQSRSLRIILSAFFRQLVNFKFKFVSVFFIILGLQGCGSHIYHFVEPGETLYSISWAYGHDYREVARWNNIPPPYILKKGQRLRVAALNPADRSPKKSIKNNTQDVVSRTGTEKEVNTDTRGANKLPPVISNTTTSASLAWHWPVKDGKIIQTFDAGNPARQGVDVQGNFGQPVYTAEAGRVVYSGSGLKHYGKLIIVKHNETFLSAYAHNKRLLVKEGDVLKSGQRIAEMGNTGTNSTKLHFEIRRNGKPVDPLVYLPRR